MQKQCVPDSLLSAHTQQPKKVCRVLSVWTGPLALMLLCACVRHFLFIAFLSGCSLVCFLVCNLTKHIECRMLAIWNVSWWASPPVVGESNAFLPYLQDNSL